MSLRRRLFKMHRAVGVGVASVLVITALSGALLVLRDYLRAAPPPCVVAVGEPLGLEALLARAVAVGPDDRVTDITLPGEGDESGGHYVFYFDDDAETVVYLAGDGVLVDRRETAKGLTRWLFRLHTGEIAGPSGETVVFASAIGLLVLTVTGLLMSFARRRLRKAP
jgi:uncharacterized iron-regulated membrane protein